MLNKIIVRLTNNPEHPLYWSIVDENNNLIKNQEIVKGSDIYVFVPGSDVFLTEVKLPKLSQSQLIKAIPYALEEYLAEDIADLHFAIGGNAKDNIFSLAVVSRKKMDEWKSRLNIFFKSQSPYLKTLVPVTLALPWKPEQWTVFIDDNKALVRTGWQSGFGVELNELWITLGLLLKQINNLLPKVIVIIGEVEIPSNEASVLKQLNVSLQLEPHQDLMTLMAASVGESSAINLLQGPYKVSHYYAKSKLYYRSAVILAVMCLLVLTIGSILQFSILNYRENVLHKKIVASFNQVFPDVKTVDERAMKKRVEQTLQSLKNANSGNIFLRIASNVAPIISRAEGVSVLGLEFAANRLTLQLEANNFELLDNLGLVLKKQGYKIELLEAVKSSNRIQAHLVIQEMKS